MTIGKHIRSLTTAILWWSIHAQGFQCPAKKYQCKVCNKYGQFSSLCYQKKTQVHHKNSCRNAKVHQLHASPMYAQDSFNYSQSTESSSDEPFFLQLQVQSNQAEGKQIPNPIHLKMNLVYCLKLHCTRNMYLQAWLDPCADVNIMPASAYQLVFKDLEMRKIKPCTMKNITYTADTVKIIGSCPFCIVHPDAKKLVPVTFLCSQYLPPGASLITSTMDNPKQRNLTSLKVHQSKQEMSAQRYEPESQVATSASIKTVQKSNPNIMITTVM